MVPSASWSAASFSLSSCSFRSSRSDTSPKSMSPNTLAVPAVSEVFISKSVTSAVNSKYSGISMSSLSSRPRLSFSPGIA